ncbi:MAG: tyrosine-type recombinase/integrase [Proteobacteria bacterium]|nr:tyrosine-type recombinase/integrase [Pseudomonadota bacterium]
MIYLILLSGSKINRATPSFHFPSPQKEANVPPTKGTTLHDQPYPTPGMPMPYPYMHMPPGYQPMPLITLQEALFGYVRYKESKGKDHKTITDIELSLRTLPFVRPDIQYINQITKRLILEYEALVSQLPANYRKNHKLRKLRFGELCEVAHRLPKLSPATIDKYVLTLRAFISWCQDTDRLPTWKLPKFEGLDRRSDKDKRLPFTAEELHKLFTSPMFTGHAADLEQQLRRHKKGPHLIKDYMYWVPILGLYSGMRLREIIQLLVTDVRREGPVIYLDLNEDGEGKSLKNNASKRQVPLHQDVINLGFLEYVESVRQLGHQRLFHNAPVTAAGAPGDIFSKRFGRYLATIGIKHKKLTFHSLRHTFIDQAARQAHLPDHLIKALVGHTDQTVTFGIYGSRISLPELAEALNKITYRDHHSARSGQNVAPQGHFLVDYRP